MEDSYRKEYRFDIMQKPGLVSCKFEYFYWQVLHMKSWLLFMRLCLYCTSTCHFNTLMITWLVMHELIDEEPALHIFLGQQYVPYQMKYLYYSLSKNDILINFNISFRTVWLFFFSANFQIDEKPYKLFMSKRRNWLFYKILIVSYWWIM